VTKRITSGAFEFLNRVLGLSGEGAQTTELDDGNVSQILEIERLVQAALAVGESGGLFTSLLTNTHAAAGTISQSMDPYVPGLTVGEFTTVNFDDVDIWYIGSSARQVSSTQTLTEVQMLMVPRAGVFQGIGETTAAVEQMALARWITILGNASAGSLLGQNLSGDAYQPHPYPFLWPRGADIRFGSIVAGAGATVLRGQSLWAMCRRGSKPSAF